MSRQLAVRHNPEDDYQDELVVPATQHPAAEVLHFQEADSQDALAHLANLDLVEPAGLVNLDQDKPGAPATLDQDVRQLGDRNQDLLDLRDLAILDQDVLRKFPSRDQLGVRAPEGSGLDVHRMVIRGLDARRECSEGEHHRQLSSIRG